MAITHIQRSALLPFSAEQLFEMVADIRAYPSFLPWCDEVEVLKETEEVVEARVVAGAAGISQSFVTRNVMRAPTCIDLGLVEGPFDHFAGRWGFVSLTDASVTTESSIVGAKLELDMRFELARKNPLLRRTFGSLFERASSTLVESFCDRVQTLYGGS